MRRAERFAFWAALAVLVAVPVLLFYPALFQGWMLNGYDSMVLGVPFKTAAQACLAQHEWPLWMPQILGGMPGIAASNLTFLHPVDLLTCLPGVSIPAGFGWDAALHVALAGVGMLLFLRRLRLSLGACLLGAFFFAISGSEISGVFGGYCNFIKGIAMVPWAFWGAHKGCQERHWGAWTVVGLAFALQILALAVQLFAYTAPALAVFVLVLARRQAPPQTARGWAARLAPYGPPLAGFVLAVTVGFLVAAPQLFLSIQYQPWSSRASFLYGSFKSGSWGLQETLTWLVPGYYGWHDPSYHGAMEDCFTSEYFGLLPWALAAGAWASLRHREWVVRWMGWLAFWSLLIALGRYTPLHMIFFHLPVYSSFRIWSRILFLLTFGLCTLAAYGWDAMAGPHRRRAFRAALGFLAATLVMAGVCWIHAAPMAEELAHDPHLIGRLGGPVRTFDLLLHQAQDSAFLAAVLVPLFLGLLWLRYRQAAVGLVLGLALVAHAVDQHSVTTRYIRFIDPRGAMVVPELVKAKLPLPGLEPWRVFEPSPLMFNDPILYGYETVGGQHSLGLQETSSLKTAMQGRQEDWLDLMNVRWQVDYSRSPEGGPVAVSVRERRGCQPRAFLVGRVTVVGDDAASYRLLGDARFDPRNEVTLLQVPSVRLGKPEGTVAWLHRSANAYGLEVDNRTGSILVLSNAWYPSWRCDVDGVAQPVLRADGALQAVELPAGHHRVEFHFDGGLFRLGLLVSLSTLMVLAVGALISFWKSRR